MAPKERAKRFSRRIKVNFRVLNEERDNAGYTTDISSTGLFVATNRQLKPGTRVRMEVADRRKSFIVEGVVTRQRRVPPQLQRIEPGGLGMRFMLVHELIQELLPNEDVEEGDTGRMIVPTDDEVSKAIDDEEPKKRTFRLRYSRAAHFMQAAKQVIETGGLFIRTQRSGRTKVNEEINIELTPPGLEPIAFEAKIVHVVAPSGEGDEENLMAGVGVEFPNRAEAEEKIKASLEKLGK